MNLMLLARYPFKRTELILCFIVISSSRHQKEKQRERERKQFNNLFILGL